LAFGSNGQATYNALLATYQYLTPDQWTPTVFRPTPYQEFSDYLRENKPSKAVKSVADR